MPTSNCNRQNLPYHRQSDEIVKRSFSSCCSFILGVKGKAKEDEASAEGDAIPDVP